MSMPFTQPWWRFGQTKPFNSIPRINYGHPLARGLDFYCYCGVTGNREYDLVSGQFAAFTTGDKIENTAQGRVHGDTYATASSSKNIMVWPAGTGTPSSAAGGAGDFSIVTGVNPGTMDNAGASVDCTGQGNSTQTKYAGLYWASNGLGSTNPFPFSFGASGDTGRITSNAISGLNTYNTFGITRAGSTLTGYFKNKSIDGLATALTTDSGSIWDSTSGVYINCFTDPSSGVATSTTIADQKFSWIGMWRRALTPNELLQLHADPYCFLIFPEDEIFATMVGSAAATFAALTGASIGTAAGIFNSIQRSLPGGSGTVSAGAFVDSLTRGLTGAAATFPGTPLSPMAPDGHAHNSSSSSLTCTATLTTTQANEPILVFVYAQSPVISASSPTLGSLTKKGAYNQGGGGATNNVEIWGAFSPGVLTGEVITITQTSALDMKVEACGVANTGQTSFVMDSGGPVTAASSPQNFTNANANVIIFSTMGEIITQAGVGSGMTLLTGSNTDFILTQYKVLSSPTTTSVGTGNDGIVVGTCIIGIVQASAGSGGQFVVKITPAFPGAAVSINAGRFFPEFLQGAGIVASAGVLTPTTAGGGVALPGAGVTSSAGTFAEAVVDLLAGASAAASAGIFSEADLIALPGASSLASAGSITRAIAVTLASASSAANAGNLVETLTDALVGAGIVGSAGTFARTIVDALTGASSTVSAGTIATIESIPALPGANVTANAGTLAKTITVALPSAVIISAAAGTDETVVVLASGATAIVASAGILSPGNNASVGLTGASSTTAAGTLAESIVRALSGAGASSGAGSFTDSSADAVTGASIGTGAGIFAETVLDLLAGAAATASAGVFSEAFTIALLSASMGSAANPFAEAEVVSTGGSGVTVSAGVFSDALSILLVGASATLGVGNFGEVEGPLLTGAATTASAGSLARAITVALSSASTAASAGILSATESSPGNANLIGAAVLGSAGIFAKADTAAIAGASAIVSSGILRGQGSTLVPGASATLTVGSFADAESAGFIGAGAGSGAGLLAHIDVSALSGASVSSSASSFADAIARILIGSSITASAGNLTPTGSSSNANAGLVGAGIATHAGTFGVIRVILGEIRRAAARVGGLRGRAIITSFSGSSVITRDGGSSEVKGNNDQ